MGYRVHLFASLREHVQRPDWVLETDAVLTGDEVVRAFFDAFPGVKRLQNVTRLAVNQAFASLDAVVQPTDELALIPPVSGG